jgi:hypothetical protein
VKRIPLWLTVVPLLVAIAGYWWFWSGYKREFRSEIAAILPGRAPVIGGFPYRLEATTVDAPVLEKRGPDFSARLTASQAILNRGPWQPALTLIRATDVRAAFAIPTLPSATLTITAPASQSSLHLDKDKRVARLSTVFDRPRIEAALLGGPATATRLEVHVRETPGRSPEAWSPTLPQRAQVVLAATDLRLGAGAPLTMAGDLRVTGPTRLIDYARWAGSGTVEVHGLTLADSVGEVMRLDGTVAVTGGTPRLSGTVVTVCPETLRAALTGGRRVYEQRLRIAVKLALGGVSGAWTLAGLPVATRAVRAQQAACPVLR